MILLLACAPEPELDRSTPGTDPVPRPSPEPQTTPAPEPDPVTPTPCDLRTPGFICRWIGQEGMALYANLEGEHRLDAYLNLPLDLEFGPDGTPYVLDWNNHRIRVVDPDDTVRTIIGVGVIGDGIFNPRTGEWNEGPGLEYKINHPTGVAFHASDPNGMYITAWHNARILRYDLTTLKVEYFAGTGMRGYGGDGGPAAMAVFDLPSRPAFDEAGHLYLLDQQNQVVRRIGVDGLVATVVGQPLVPGFDGDGDALSRLLQLGSGETTDPGGAVWHEGAVYFTDVVNQLVRRFDPVLGTVETVAGTWVPNPIAIDTDGDLIGDLVRGLGGFAGDGGPAVEARLNNPLDLAFGPDGALYVADTFNHCVRVISPDGLIDTFAGRCGFEGFVVPTTAGPRAHDVPAGTALLSQPSGVAVDPAGNVYIADTYNQVIRVVWAAPGGSIP